MIRFCLHGLWWVGLCCASVRFAGSWWAVVLAAFALAYTFVMLRERV